MAEEQNDNIVISEKGIEILVAKLVPTSQYFERSFELLRGQIEDVKEGQRDNKKDIDRRFGQVEKRIDEVNENQKALKDDIDKRFEQVDKRFEQVDKRFEQVNEKLDTIIERVDMKIDAGLRENRAMSFKLFSFAMVFSAISMAGFLAKISGLF